MKKTIKKSAKDRVIEGILFLFLIAFPFGQLLKLELPIAGFSVSFQFLDLLAGLTIPILFLYDSRSNKYSHIILSFLIASLFSLALSLSRFSPDEMLVGFLYWLRLLSYATFFLVSLEYVRKYLKKKLLLKSLIAVCFFVAIFGWIQYFFYPDLTWLKILGWDDHLYRLAGTFLDPGFTSIILVLGTLTSISFYFKKKDKRLLLAVVFLVFSVAFTYARAAYLALGFGLAVLLALEKKFKILIFIPIFFLVVLPFLPRPGGEGVRLERTASVYARIRNYKETFEIAKDNPLFGVGYNNICIARLEVFGGEVKSNACHGADSSLLFVFTTTGVVGLFAYISMAYRLLGGVDKKTLYGKAFIANSGALFIHSFFVNSLFYSWIMGWMGILLAISARKRD